MKIHTVEGVAKHFEPSSLRGVTFAPSWACLKKRKVLAAWERERSKKFVGPF